MRMLALGLFFVSTPVMAHELWIDPLPLGPEGRLEAHLVNGQNYEGTELIYMSRSTARLDVHYAGDTASIEMRLGDKPAIAVDPMGDGLHVLIYQSEPATLRYDTWDDFQRFSDHKDLNATVDAHNAAGHPAEDFIEVYRRFSKSLVAFGDPLGADDFMGMEAELIALDNPYQGGDIAVQLLYQGTPLPDTQIEVFAKTDGVTVSYIRTDANGVATVPTMAGVSYMLDSVILRAPSPDLAEATGAVYETLWANLTFRVPE